MSVTLDQLRQGTKFRFVDHSAVFEVVDSADVKDSEVGILHLNRGTYYTVEGGRTVEIANDLRRNTQS